MTVRRRDFLRLSTTAATLALTGFPRSARAASAVLGDDVDGSRWLQPVPADACAMISLEGAFHA
jgi:hypothetical protein